MTASSSSSQGSTASTASTFSSASAGAARKRFYVADEDEQQQWNREEWIGGTNGRILAVPKSRRKAAGISFAGMGRRNMAVDDFDEAPFLELGQGDGMELE